MQSLTFMEFRDHQSLMTTEIFFATASESEEAVGIRAVQARKRVCAIQSWQERWWMQSRRILKIAEPLPPRSLQTHG